MIGVGRQASRRLVVAVLLATVAIIVTWVYLPVLDATTIWLDDASYVTRNPLVLNPSWSSTTQFLSEVRRPSTVDGYYQPVTMISLMVDSATGGDSDDLRPFHRTSLGLHVLNTILLISLLVLLFGEPVPAVMVGLLFGVHPLTVEPVAWLAERKTLLSTCFALTALVTYVRYTQTAGPGRKPWWLYWYAGSIACYGLALASKPTSTPLPLLLLLLDYWPLRRSSRQAILEKIPFFVLGALAAVVTVISQQTAGTISYPVDESAYAIALTVCHNVGFYLWKIIWPAHLAAYYLYPAPMSLQTPALLAGVVGTCALILAIAVSTRWTRAVLTGGLFYLVALFPTVGLVRFTAPIASEKYAYLPSVGIALVVAWLLGRAWALARYAATRGRGVRIAIGLVVFVFVAVEARATRRYLDLWQNDETLYGYVLSHSPSAWWLQYDFGVKLARQGRMDEALSRLLQAESGEPDDVDVQAQLGNVLLSLGRSSEAVGHYRNVLRVQPRNGTVLYNLALSLVQLGQPIEASTSLRAALDIDPQNAAAHNALGILLAQQGHPDQAIPHYRAALAVDPTFVAAHVNLADALRVTGQMPGAADEYRAAIALAPDDPALHNNFGAALLDQGMTAEAISEFQTALRLNPALDHVQRNLRAALARRALVDGSTQ